VIDAVLLGLYWLSLAVIVGSAIVGALHREVWIGPFGSALLGGVAAFALVGFERSPREWLVGMLACCAALALYCFRRWRIYLMEQRIRALRGGRRRTDRPREAG
jgi:hypothetical protein